MTNEDLNPVLNEPSDMEPDGSGSIPALSDADGIQKNDVSETLESEAPEIKNEVDSDILLLPSDDGDDDNEENDDPANLPVQHSGSVEYSSLDRTELLSELSTLIQTGEIEKIRLQVDSIKLNFYKKLKSGHKEVAPEEGDVSGATEVEKESDPQEEQMKSLLKKYRDLRAQINQNIETERQSNLEQKFGIIEELKDLVNKNESIGDTFQQFRDLQNRWRSIGLVPQSEVKNLWETYHHYVEIFYDYIKINKELRDLDLKKNLEMKLQICEKAEGLLLESSEVKAFNTLQELHDQWREVGPVPQEMRTEIWERFKTASSMINKKHQAYYEELKDSLQKNLEAKSALCEKAEEILSATIQNVADWEKYSRELVDIQKIWFSIGYAPKRENNKIYKRFRTACDAFFSRKREYFSQSREEQHNNLQLKEDLCNQAEALKDSSEWKETAEDFIQLQKRWKEIGPVPRKHRDVIWKRFRSACDFFFENKSKHMNEQESEFSVNYKAKLALIEQINNFKPSENMDDNFVSLKEFQREWSKIGFVPIKYKDKIQIQYRETINRQFDALRIDEGKRNMMRYRNKIEGMAAVPQSRNKMENERDKLFRRLQQLQNDIVVWENNIGFFSKSKNAESMIANVQQMIQQGKEELRTIEDKIRLIDKME